jgi:YtoQ family protein
MLAEPRRSWRQFSQAENIMIWKVYLSGEIHSDWRERIIAGATDRGLPVEFSSPITDHDASDAAGDMLGPPSEGYWRDHKSSRVNGIRTRTLLEKCDLAVIRFGDKYKQWNAAFDAGFCAALGKAYITLHDADIVHPLKEVDAAAMAWAETPEQVVDILAYVVDA